MTSRAAPADTSSDPELYGNRAQCLVCREYFNTARAYDGHRISGEKGRRCMTVAELKADGWSKNASGLWVTRRSPRVPEAVGT